jgi:hypothetical protein
MGLYTNGHVRSHIDRLGADYTCDFVCDLRANRNAILWAISCPLYIASTVRTGNRICDLYTKPHIKSHASK